jgi:hypothetical protein
MYYKIEKSGCCERKGMVQIRYCFYLDKEDYGYEKHYIDVPIIPEDFDYKRDEKIIEEEIKKLPTEKKLTPFHNHFSYFSPEATDKEIKDAGDKFLNEAYDFWKKDEFPNVQNLTKPTASSKEACELRINEIKLWQ